MKHATLAAAVALIAVAGCGDEPVAPNTTVDPLAPLVDHDVSPTSQEVEVCKFHDMPGTWAQFSISGSGGTFPAGNVVVLPALPFPIRGENCALVWVSDGSVGNYPLTIAETDMTPGTFVESIAYFQERDPDNTIVGSNFITLDVDTNHGAVAAFKNAGEARRDGEGCTPGAWKNRLYKRDLWPAPYSGNPDLEDYFTTTGFAFGSDSFLDALKYKGSEGDGKVSQEAHKLMRSAVAALLNAASQDYAYSEAEVVALTNAALASGDWVQMNDLKDEFDFENNRGCAFDD